MSNTEEEPDAIATQDDDKIEQLPAAMPGDVPAPHDSDPTYEPPPGFDEGLGGDDDDPDAN